MTSKIFNTYLEYNVQHNKYIDIAIFKREGTKVKYQAIIEVKYIKKGNYSKEELEKKRLEAIDQIIKYGEDKRIPKEGMKKFVVVFVGDKAEIVEEVGIM